MLEDFEKIRAVFLFKFGLLTDNLGLSEMARENPLNNTATKLFRTAKNLLMTFVISKV